jgi:hypothetical protein
MSSETRLIWTINGNMDLDSLEHSVAWEDTPDYVKFIETYLHNGVVVKQSAHVLARRALLSEPVIQLSGANNG